MPAAWDHGICLCCQCVVSLTLSRSLGTHYGSPRSSPLETGKGGLHAVSNKPGNIMIGARNNAAGPDEISDERSASLKKDTFFKLRVKVSQGAYINLGVLYLYRRLRHLTVVILEFVPRR